MEKEEWDALRKKEKEELDILKKIQISIKDLSKKISKQERKCKERDVAIWWEVRRFSILAEDFCNPKDHNFQKMDDRYVFCSKCGDVRQTMFNPKEHEKREEKRIEEQKKFRERFYL